MKTFFLTLCCLCFATLARAQSPRHVDSVFGSGNTGDLTLQLSFARSTALAYVRALPPQDLWPHTDDLAVRQLYRECRPVLLEGLLSLSFEVVANIPDGQGLHAFMQRSASKVRISRHEYERGIAGGLVTGPSLVAHVLHEVGHDCVIEGRKLDDGDDALLDRLGSTIVNAGVSKNLSPFSDYQVIRDVREGKAVAFESFSAKIREELTRQILDFAGEKLYFSNRALILDRFGERPTSASRLERSFPGSRIPTWSEISPGLSFMDQIFVRQFIVGSLRMNAPSRATHTGADKLPRSLRCVSAAAPADRAIRCRLSVRLEGLEVAERLEMKIIDMDFRLNIFGEIQTEAIHSSK